MEYTGANSPAVNPFSTPVASRSASSVGFSSAIEPPPSVNRPRYYHSRRILRDPNRKPPKFKKDPGEKWLWIIPLLGLVLGLCITGLLVYMAIGGKTNYNYCPILNENFASGQLDSSIWMKDVEVGGFGNGQFEMTTADDENAFIKDGKLHIKPTLQDENLINSNSVINLTALGTCTSDQWYNCVTSTNTTNGTIIQPVKSARLNTRNGAKIKYGRVEVEAKLPKGDWLWPAIWMMPVKDTYGPWPASGEIDIMEARGNNHTYSPGGNNIVTSSLHWGPNPDLDAYAQTGNSKNALHSEYGDNYHIYGLEWTDKYLFTYIDTTLLQVFYYQFSNPFWPQGHFPLATQNGTRLVDPWSLTGRPQTPFDQEFYLIINVGVGARNGWFPDGKDHKPWVDASPTAKKDFWAAKDSWYPSWQNGGEMLINSVKMWQQC